MIFDPVVQLSPVIPSTVRVYSMVSKSIFRYMLSTKTLKRLLFPLITRIRLMFLVHQVLGSLFYPGLTPISPISTSLIFFISYFKKNSTLLFSLFVNNASEVFRHGQLHYIKDDMKIY